MDDGPAGCLWPELPFRGPLKQWLAALATVALLLAVFYIIFSMLQ